ncbi:MAG: hypothetical protein AVDCRST_MAG76-770, partial [uncultured Acidimicrobiales bacterium]
ASAGPDPPSPEPRRSQRDPQRRRARQPVVPARLPAPSAVPALHRLPQRAGRHRRRPGAVGDQPGGGRSGVRGRCHPRAARQRRGRPPPAGDRPGRSRRHPRRPLGRGLRGGRLWRRPRLPPPQPAGRVGEDPRPQLRRVQRPKPRVAQGARL